MSSSVIRRISGTILFVNHLVVYLYVIESVSSDCATSVSQINHTFVRLPETTKEHVFVNMTISNEIWKFYIEEIDNHKPIPLEWKQIFDERFKIFTNSTSLLLMTTQALDKELLYNITGEDIQIITIALLCEDVNTSQVIDLPLHVLIQSEDEFPPRFTEAPYHISVPENLPVGSHVYDLGEHVTDEDIPRDTQFTYAVEEFQDNSTDRRMKFGIPDGSTGIVVIQEALDYEAMVQAGLKFYILKVSVTDSGGLTSNTTINITVTDADDLGPVLINPGCNATGCDVISYRAITTSFYRGTVTVEPPISARDGDTLNYTVLFSLEKHGYDSSFRINHVTGELKQIDNVFKPGVLVVKAVENSTNRHQAVTSVLVILSDNANKTNSSNDTTLQITTEGLAVDLKTILGITCSGLIVVIIGLIVGLCIQHRRYLKSTRPIQSLTYLYVRSFKRRKPKDHEHSVPDSDEQTAKSLEETEMSASGRTCKTQTNENSNEKNTVASIHAENLYSDNKDVGINLTNERGNDLVSEVGAESNSSQLDLSPPNSDFSDTDDEMNSEINYIPNSVDDTQIVLANTSSNIEAQDIHGTDNPIYAYVNKNQTDSPCEQFSLEISDGDDEEVFV